jgi:MFS family permease
MSMVAIAIVLMIQELHGSYALGGRVSAAYIIAQAVCSPQIAKLVDRKGQSHIMRPMFAITCAALGGLILCAQLEAPEFTLYLFAVLTGSTVGSVGSMVRARWSYLLTDPRQVHSAYSFESAVDELCFVVGPMLATILATSVTPTAGLIVPLVAILFGGYWFLSASSTEPPPSIVVAGEKRTSILLNPGMLALIAVFIGIGALFGATDVATIAFAEEEGHKSAAGAILAVFALGSLISGLLYGAKNWLSALWMRFAIGMIALALGVTLFFFVTSIPVLCIIMFVTGFAISPTIINGNNLVQLLIPPNQLTEGLTWVGTALGVGVSAGTSIAGQRIDAVGSHGGFTVVMLSAMFAVVVMLASLTTVRRLSARSSTPA